MGEPSEILRDLRQGVLEEAWFYEKDDFTSLMILFRDGQVALIKEF